MKLPATLDTINEAYEKLYDSMYQETAMDVFQRYQRSSDVAGPGRTDRKRFL